MIETVPTMRAMSSGCASSGLSKACQATYEVRKMQSAHEEQRLH
jgi:hypothetical protein